VDTKVEAAGPRFAGWATAVGALGTPAVIAVAHPLLAAGLLGAELALVCMVLVTFVCGSDAHRETMFRLLRLLKGQPEPAPPIKEESGRLDGSEVHSKTATRRLASRD
jgi:hypothetical protein